MAISAFETEVKLYSFYFISLILDDQEGGRCLGNIYRSIYCEVPYHFGSAR